MGSFNQNLEQPNHWPDHGCQFDSVASNKLPPSGPAKVLGQQDGDDTLHEELENYEKYLDDYSYCRKERLKRNAMDKYNLIMQSVKIKSKDQFPHELDDEEFKDAQDDDMLIYDIEGSPAISSSSSDTKLSRNFLTCYKKILKRHVKRLSDNQHCA